MKKHKTKNVLQKEIDAYLASHLKSPLDFGKKHMLISRDQFVKISYKITDDVNKTPASLWVKQESAHRPLYILFKKNISFRNRVFDVVLLSPASAGKESCGRLINSVIKSIDFDGTLLISSYHLSRIDDLVPDMHKYNNINGENILNFQIAGNVLHGSGLGNATVCTERISVHYNCPYMLFLDLILVSKFSRKRIKQINRFFKLKICKNYRLKFEVVYGQALQLDSFSN